MLDVFITSRVRRKLIILYSKYPDFKTHVRGLAKLLKEDAGNIQRELAKLEEVGFLRSHSKKNTKVYQANTAFPIFRELQGMVLKSQRRAPASVPAPRAEVLSAPRPAPSVQPETQATSEDEGKSLFA